MTPQELQMVYFILFLFVAYVAPVFFLSGIELIAASHTVEKDNPAMDSQEAHANA